MFVSLGTIDLMLPHVNILSKQTKLADQTNKKQIYKFLNYTIHKNIEIFLNQYINLLIKKKKQSIKKQFSLIHCYRPSRMDHTALKT